MTSFVAICRFFADQTNGKTYVGLFFFFLKKKYCMPKGMGYDSQWSYWNKWFIWDVVNSSFVAVYIRYMHSYKTVIPFCMCGRMPRKNSGLKYSTTVSDWTVAITFGLSGYENNLFWSLTYECTSKNHILEQVSTFKTARIIKLNISVNGSK